MDSITTLKGLDSIDNAQYEVRQAMIFPRYQAAFSFSLNHILFNLFHRNEIILGSNEVLYKEADIPSTSWEHFRAAYNQYKNNLEMLLDKTAKLTIQDLEETTLFPVFSLPNQSNFQKLLEKDYPQVVDFNKKMQKVWDESNKLDNRFLYSIGERIYYNLMTIARDNYTQSVYLPLNEIEFESFINTLDFLQNDLDKKLYTQTYNYIEKQLMEGLFVFWKGAPLRFIQVDEASNSDFYYQYTLNNDDILLDFEIPTTGEYTMIRQYLTEVAEKLVFPYYSYLLPEALLHENLSDDYFKQLNESQLMNLFCVAFSSYNTYLMLRLLRNKELNLYHLLQHKDPMYLSSCIYLLGINLNIIVLLEQSWRETLNFYEDDWGESPFVLTNLVANLNHKISLYPNFDNLIYLVLKSVAGSPEERNLTNIPSSIIWDNIKNIQSIDF